MAAKDETTIADIVKQMSDSTRSQPQADWKKQQATARQERIDEEAEVARRAAVATLNEKDRRERDWCFSNLGSLSDHELRKLIRQEHGFEPI
jgi:isoleucyl-tRNA synthetase